MEETRAPQFDIIFLASDHAGFELKNEIMNWLSAGGFAVVDGGAEEFEAEDDFPDYIIPVAKTVSEYEGKAGAIIFGGSGQGEAMAANRIKGIRAVVYYGREESIVPLSRQHNNSNILSLGARFVSCDEVKRVIWEWLHTKALNDNKYDRRNRKLDDHT